MSLAERLAQNERPDRVAEVRARIQHQMVEVLGPTLYDSTISEREMRDLVHRRLNELLTADDSPLSAREKKIIVTDITDGVLGLGPLEPLIKDDTVTEIMVNGPDSIYVERDGQLFQTDEHFFDEQQLRRTIEKIVAKVGRRIDEASPYVDARLADGSRVNAIIPPLALDGAALTIRKFSAEAYRVEELIAFGTWNAAAAEFMDACVSGRMNVIVSGGTGAGKTTTLNVLSSFIPSNERIITIEDAAELRLQQPHIVRLESRPPNIEGSGEVTIRDLVRNALRMRPNRIVIGEVRGGEALDMLQAMNTGHDGSISTVHANTPRDVLGRLETMVLMAGTELTVKAVREQISSAVDIIVHQARLKDGTRRVTHISEVLNMEGDVITLQDIYKFDFHAGVNPQGRFIGEMKPTGIRPKCLEKLADAGITVSPTAFIPEGGRTWSK
jgi:pilus assembly protein CpaF